jgi:hypothetical protein
MIKNSGSRTINAKERWGVRGGIYFVDGEGWGGAEQSS